ncbi:MAG TPA: hypothetical protein VFF52_08835 [Isosphaeraceae bacterium]|nr:hypothetical protein [Isosphaeraceae bacterium]
MKSTYAALALSGALAAGTARAQAPSQGPMPSTPPPNGAGSSAPAPGETRVYPAASALPGPTPVEAIPPPAMALPDDPIEPYLLTKANGPFMVHAKTFYGPLAERMALALCKELREDFHLPAYILRKKDFPQHSYIRGTPPTAPSETMTSAIKNPEKVRTHDEAAVLIGDEKTLAGSEVLLHKVKKLHPKCLEKMPGLWEWRRGAGLRYATRTTNPYVPAQYLYPKTKDKLVLQMNSGLRSIGHCAGSYSLQVAEFSGRSGFDFHGVGGPPPIVQPENTSPLKTAHDDAERMADKLGRSPEIQRLGVPVYVYHDRTSSRVFVGSFASENDPAFTTVRNELLKHAVDLSNRKQRGRAALDVMIVPAMVPTNVAQIKAQLQ